MNKTFLFSALTVSLIAGLILTYVYTRTSYASASIMPKNAAKSEANIKDFLTSSMSYFHPQKDWVKVGNCKITYRLYRNPTCSDNGSNKYNEYQIDLREVGDVHYFEVPRSRSRDKASITFDFKPAVQKKFDEAKDYFWKATGERETWGAVMWSIHLATEEQNVVSQMKLDKTGSYSITENCTHSKRERHLPYAINTINLERVNREAVHTLQLYHAQCNQNS